MVKVKAYGKVSKRKQETQQTGKMVCLGSKGVTNVINIKLL